jgi:hypothetical protein
MRGYKTNTNYKNNQGFNTDTIGGNFVFGHLLFERVFGSFSYTIENVLIKDVTANAPFLVQQQPRAIEQTLVIQLLRFLEVGDGFVDPVASLQQ